MSSTGSRRPITRASFAGVSPRARRTSSPRETFTSTSMRARALSSSTIASSATSGSSPCATTKRSITSKSAASRPSIRVTTPSTTTSSGAGSFGPCAATRPSSGSGETSCSRCSSRRSRDAKRLLAMGEQSSVQVRGGGLAHERRRLRREKPLQAHCPVLEFCFRRPALDAKLCRRRAGGRPARQRARPPARNSRQAGCAQRRARPRPASAVSRASLESRPHSPGRHGELRA